MDDGESLSTQRGNKNRKVGGIEDKGAALLLYSVHQQIDMRSDRYEGIYLNW